HVAAVDLVGRDDHLARGGQAGAVVVAGQGDGPVAGEGRARVDVHEDRVADGVGGSGEHGGAVGEAGEHGDLLAAAHADLHGGDRLGLVDGAGAADDADFGAGVVVVLVEGDPQRGMPVGRVRVRAGVGDGGRDGADADGDAAGVDADV